MRGILKVGGKIVFDDEDPDDLVGALVVDRDPAVLGGADGFRELGVGEAFEIDFKHGAEAGVRDLLDRSVDERKRRPG
jgi:hypothetical protein